MEEWVVRWLEAERAKGKKGLEVKRIGNSYYLYKSTTVWDKKEKKRKKKSQYIGKLTPEGLIESERRIAIRSIYEYGNAALLKYYISEIEDSLKNAFPNYYKEIIAISIVKTISPLPIKLIGSMWKKLYLSHYMKVSLSPNTISKILKEIGADWLSQKLFFDSLLTNEKVLLFDLSSIYSRSVNIRIAERGYNKNHFYLKQINFLLFFSPEHNIPVMLKPVPGSIKDINAFKTILKEITIKDVIIIMDRGLASYKLAKMLHAENILYIMPLRRNFKIIDYEINLSEFFIYRDRSIKWGKKKTRWGILYLFEDVKLRAEEEITFIEQICMKNRNKEDYERVYKKFGKIAILSNLDEDGENVYKMYKLREGIECAFDAFKNTLECDKTYLHDDDAVRGFFFIAFICLYLYYRILRDLKEAGMLNKISVRELLLEFSKVYMIAGKNKTYIWDIPEKVLKLHDALKLDLFPKNLRS